MKNYNSDQIKNLTLLGNAGSGKTTLAEIVLFNGKVISRIGNIENKNTVSDYNEIEHERQSSVYSSVMYTEINGNKINIVDAPGLDDFVGGVVTSLGVTDAALMVLNSQHGVEVGTEIHWRNTNKYNKPVIFVANQLDHDNANFDKVVESTKQAFGPKVTLAQYPINPGPNFNAVIDLIKMSMLKWSDKGGNAEVLPIPESELDKANELHAQLVEAAAESDEKLMESFFENETLTEEELINGIQMGVKTRGIFPVFCASASKNMGVIRLMEFISTLAPSPIDMPAAKTFEDKEIECDPKAPVSIYVFKTSIEHHLGEISYFKVMSGTLKEGMDLINVNTGSKERVSQIYCGAGKNRVKVTSMSAGDIGATVKLKDTKTDNSLSEKELSCKFIPIELPNSKYRVAIKALDESDDEKVSEILQKMHLEDPTLILEYSKELKQLILHGQGELHLNTVKWAFDNIHNVGIEFIAPKIPYRETITKLAQSQYRHKKQSGGAGQFGEVYLFIEPHSDDTPDRIEFKANGKEMKISIRKKDEYTLDWGGKFVFYNCIVGGSIDTRFLPAIYKGIMEKLENGPLTGSYARDIRVYVYDGKMHPVDSNEISFKIAGAKAFSDAFKQAGAKIMEPVYDVEILVPSERMGDVMSDLQGRRSIILGMSSEGGAEKISCKVPLAEMNKYSTILSSLTNGRATYSMKFSEYTQVPMDVQEKLLAEYEAEQDEE